MLWRLLPFLKQVPTLLPARLVDIGTLVHCLMKRVQKAEDRVAVLQVRLDDVVFRREDMAKLKALHHSLD